MGSEMKYGKSSQALSLDWYTIVKDVAKEWSFILMISIAAMLLSYSLQYTRYTPKYSMTATFSVGTREATTNVYSSLSQTSSTASTFAKVLDSPLMQKKIGEDIGYNYMPGTANVNMIENTNLLELTVTENSPKLTNEVYHSIMKNYNEISRPLLGDIVLSTLIDSEIPTKPTNPFSPQKGMERTFIIALIAAIIFITVLVILKDTVRKEEDIENKLDAKLLGTLAHEKKFKKGQKRSKEKKAVLISDATVSFRYAESVKTLAGKVTAKMNRRRAKTVLVTSVMENEGKSTVAANLALAMSQSGAKVLLIDGDFRKPAMFKVFNMDPDKIENFGEVLNGKVNISNLICKREDLNLSMILNCVRYPDSTDMIGNKLMAQVIAMLEKRFDYIVIDSSPMALVADTQEWMEIIDSAILVVRQNISSVRDINDAISILNRDKVKLLGCVFNNVQGKKDKYSNERYGNYRNYDTEDRRAQYQKEENYESYSKYSRYGTVDSIQEEEEGGE